MSHPHSPDLEPMIEKFHESFWKTLLQMGLFFLLLCALLLFPMYCLSHLIEIESVPQIALPGMVWLQMWNTSIRHARGKNSQVGAIFEQLLLVAAFFAILEMGQYLSGDLDNIIDYVKANFAEIMMFVVCFCVAAYFRRMGDGLAAQAQSLVAPYLGLWEPDTQRKLTEHDKNVIATHEAGHAIVLGLHRELPLDMKIVMRNKPSDSGSLGYCTGVAWKHALENKAYVEWDMLFSLAGIEAERIVLGEVSLGGSSDYDHWNHLAQSYLTGHDELIYFHTPLGNWQEDHNHKMLADLKKAQQVVVRELLIENENILLLLRDQLRTERKVSGLDFITILNKVGAVGGCPVSPLFKTFQG